MASLNKVMIIGNAGRDAELRYLANGTATAQFSVAVSRNFRGPDNNWREETEWFNVVAWRELAERVSQMVTKGKQVYVEGRLQTRSWDNNEGVKQYRTELVANTVLLLERRSEGQGGGAGGGGGGWDEGGPPSRGRPSRGGGGGGDEGIDPDDLPFE
jgi:single-strand DNA-binding protein